MDSNIISSVSKFTSIRWDDHAQIQGNKYLVEITPAMFCQTGYTKTRRLKIDGIIQTFDVVYDTNYVVNKIFHQIIGGIRKELLVTKQQMFSAFEAAWQLHLDELNHTYRGMICNTSLWDELLYDERDIQLSKLHKEISDHLTSIDARNSALDHAIKEHDKVEQKLQIALSELKQARIVIVDLQQKVNELEKVCQKLEEAERDDQSHESDLADLLDERNSLKAQNLQLENQINQLKAVNDVLVLLDADSCKRIIELDEHINHLNCMIEEKQNLINDLCNRITLSQKGATT